MNFTGRLVAAAGRDGEALPALAPHPDAKARQQIQRDLDVRLGDQLAGDFETNVLLGHQGQRHQQGCQKLARHITANGNGFVQRELARLQVQGRKSVLAQIVNAAAKLAQRIDQVADGALVHARHAREFIVAAQQCQRGRQRAHGGAGVAHEQLALAVQELAAQPANHSGLAGLLNTAAHLSEGSQHHGGVVRGQQVMHHGFAPAQRRQQQHAVGNAFRARQMHSAVCAGQWRNVQRLDIKHETESILMR